MPGGRGQLRYKARMKVSCVEQKKPLYAVVPTYHLIHKHSIGLS